MCFPPLAWQTYDIYFSAARWQDGQKVRPARITVLHNGEPIHVNYDLIAKTGGGKAEGPQPFPILLQNHNNPVLFRNIWLVPGGSMFRAGESVAWASGCEMLPSPRASLLVRGAPRSMVSREWAYR
jgi:hypothetical protein